MNRYNHHLNTHFRSCHLLAKAYDPYRERNVEVRLIPGEFDVVGVSDGVDAWVCPTSIDPFGINLVKILDTIRNTGELPSLAPASRPRHPIPASVVAAVGVASRERHPISLPVDLPRRRNVIPT